VSMGNPHAVVEVADAAAAPLHSLGAALSTNEHFPQGCNVGVAQIVDRKHLKLRVWERGVGITLACGTGACAAVAVLRRRAKLESEVSVQLPGGKLDIRWDGPQHTLWMTGPATFVYEGDFNE
jgi:diaminopimelate epimerase